MKALTKLVLAALILTTTVAAQADWVRGYVRSNGTYVAPHYRTPANGTPYDNLSYRVRDLTAALEDLNRLVYAPLAEHLTNVSHLIVFPTDS